MLELLLENRLPADRLEALAEQIGANEAGYDPWGVHLPTVERSIVLGRWLYKHYFRVRTFGLENVPEGSVMIVPNHSGQLPLDGMLIAIAFLYEADPPRLLRSMIEKWLPRLPFVGGYLQRCGQVVGDPQNGRRLLEQGQSVQVFPEGVRGSGKTWWKRYQLQRFGTGFMRLALETGTPIVPTAVLGCEDTYPSMVDLKPLARLLGMPYFPLWPQAVLGPLALAPIPIQVDLRFGEPLTFDCGPNAPDEEIHANVRQVKDAIRELIAQGLAERERPPSVPPHAGGPRGAPSSYSAHFNAPTNAPPRSIASSASRTRMGFGSPMGRSSRVARSASSSQPGPSHRHRRM